MTVRGLPHALARLAQLREDMHAGSAEGQRDTAAEVAQEWRAGAPVETGEHRDGIRSDDEGAYATADHSPFVEFGTSTHTAHQDGSGAAHRVAGRMPKIVGNEIRKRLPR